MLRIFYLCLLGLCQQVSATPTNDNALSQFLQDLPRLQAHFVQQRFDEDNELLERSEGQFFIQRPDKFRWVYKQPYQQLIVANEKYIFIYEKDLAQVTVKKASETLHNSPIILLMENGDNLTKNFNVTSTAKDNAETLILTPKKDGGQFQTLTIQFIDKQLHALEFIDALEQRTRIEFDQVKRNPTLDAHLFEFTPPEGVDLIDGRDG